MFLRCAGGVREVCGRCEGGVRELRGADSAPPPNALSTQKNKIPAPSEAQGVVQGVLLEIWFKGKFGIIFGRNAYNHE